MSEEELQKHRVDWWERLGGIVGIVSLPVIIWHGFMMQNGNMLNREQFEAAEQHRIEDSKNASEEKRPIMVPAVGSITLRFKEPLPGEEVKTTGDQTDFFVANIGKSAGINSECDWHFDNKSNGWRIKGFAPRRLTVLPSSVCMPGEKVITSGLSVASLWEQCSRELGGHNLARFDGTLIITCSNAENAFIETEQQFLVEVERVDSMIDLSIVFQQRTFVVRPVR